MQVHAHNKKGKCSPPPSHLTVYGQPCPKWHKVCNLSLHNFNLTVKRTCYLQVGVLFPGSPIYYLYEEYKCRYIPLDGLPKLQPRETYLAEYIVSIRTVPVRHSPCCVQTLSSSTKEPRLWTMKSFPTSH